MPLVHLWVEPLVISALLLAKATLLLVEVSAQLVVDPRLALVVKPCWPAEEVLLQVDKYVWSVEYPPLAKVEI